MANPVRMWFNAGGPWQRFWKLMLLLVVTLYLTHLVRQVIILKSCGPLLTGHQWADIIFLSTVLALWFAFGPKKRTARAAY